jgi:hypothetical protein
MAWCRCLDGSAAQIQRVTRCRRSLANPHRLGLARQCQTHYWAATIVGILIMRPLVEGLFLCLAPQ